MIPLDEALRWVLDAARPLGDEEVPLDEAPGRVLAIDLHARWDLPPFDASARDEVLLAAPVAPGTNVRRRGEDASAGRALVERGATIDASMIGLLASFGFAAVPVTRRPRVAILGTGDELVAVEEARPGVVVESNSHALAALAREAGALANRLPFVADRPELIRARVAEALDGAEVVITIGGSSVGEHDRVREAAAALGARERFWGVAMRPGRPCGFALVGERLLFGLPGTPAAATATFEALVRPAIRALLGARDLQRPAVAARFSAPVGAGRDANALLVAPPGRDRLEPGDAVTALLVGAPDSTAPAWSGPLSRARRSTPVLGVIGPSGVGKTTLVERLLERLAGEGLRVGALKHDAHEFQMDRDGKDTFRFRHAGAVAVAIASRTQRALIAATDRATTLAELVASLPPDLDLVLVEGYKAEETPKIEVHRRGLPLLCRGGVSDVVAVVTDDEEAPLDGRVRLARDDLDGALAFVKRFLRARS